MVRSALQGQVFAEHEVTEELQGWRHTVAGDSKTMSNSGLEGKERKG